MYYYQWCELVGGLTTSGHVDDYEYYDHANDRAVINKIKIQK